MQKSAPTLPVVDNDDKKDRRRNMTSALNRKIDPMVPVHWYKNPRILLAMACLWPLAIMALFASSSPGRQISSSSDVISPNSLVDNSNTAHFNWRSVLDRVDVVGYGPTHPRVAFVVVGETKEDIIASVKSIFTNTDMNRIFVICAVLDDGKGKDPTLVKKLRKIENGSVPHWHGLKRDVHDKDKKPEDDENLDGESHSPKIHVLFNSEKKGVTASRADAAEFVHILERTHERAGLKSREEDLILVLLQAGSKFRNHSWLKPVTRALIVPPPLLGLRDENVAMKVANAISFHVENAGEITSFDTRFSPITKGALDIYINQSSGHSFPTPALNGAAVAMRLGTFLNLPAIEPSMAMDAWSANIDLSLNLWLCADGIDILEEVDIIPPPGGIYPESPMTVEQVARFATVWMEEDFRDEFFEVYSTVVEDDDQYKITRLDWDTEVTKSRRLNKSSDLFSQCRSFQWYIQEVNNDLLDIIDRDDEAELEEEAGTEFPEEVEAHIEPPDAESEAKEEEATDGNHKPSQPLRPNNLEIVQAPKMMDIAFVDVSNGHQEFPHKLALDENGVPGYIHDETALRRNPPVFNYPGIEAGCNKKDGNAKMFKERIIVETEYDKKMEDSGNKRDKIFCLVYTIESSHPKIQNIRETWGPKCDGFMVGSNKTDSTIGAVNIPHEGPEEYNNIWQKVRSMWSYIYDNYYEKYDWFHIGGDDLFLIVENLRYYLESEEIRTASNGGIYLPTGNESKQTPLFLGRRFAYMGDMNEIFNSGGSGYTMNKAALKMLVTEGFPNYFPHAHTFSEDTMVAKLFKKIDNVVPYDTKDDAGGERYMPFDPENHSWYHLPKKIVRSPKEKGFDWYAIYSIDIKGGLEHCSPQSIAFHYIKGDLMKRLYALGYGLCKNN